MIAGLTALTGALGSGGALGADPADQVKQSIANRTPIHVAPCGVNLGAILAPFNEGSPSNGGYGLELPGRYQTVATAAQTTLTTKTGSNLMLLLIAGGIGVGALLIMRR